MVTEFLHVWLHGTHVADIQRSPDGRLTLRYQPDGRAVSVSMPATVETHTDARVRAWLAGLLPDNDTVLDRWARVVQAAPTPFSLLGTEIGLDCAGAVQFTPGGQELPSVRTSGVRWLDEDELTQLVARLHDDRAGWGVTSEQGRFSLAGAQSKTALRLEEGRWGVPYGDEPSNVILKPGLVGFDGHEVNEHLCLEAARRCGIHVARTRVVEVGPYRVIAAWRYDRTELDGSVRRVHQEDLCQAMGVPPTRRYQADGGPGARQVADLLRRVETPGDAHEDVRRLADALLLNWLLVGTDAHAKNYSLLLPNGGRVRLAPLYDVASFAPYGDWRGAKLAMKLGGEYRLKALYPSVHVPRLATEVGIDPAWAVERATELARRVPEALVEAASSSGLGHDPAATRLVDAVAEHARLRRPWV